VTDLEKLAVTTLRSVIVPEQVWHGHAIERLNMRMTIKPDDGLPVSDRADLWFLVWRYRRQIDDDKLIREANKMVNGALSLEF
jgi:hypothetical protein